ncbi:GSCFA domain-containing protein [Shewanella marina]|uniref:GSCFA domain-containing protein n=1 Tax=Shewanella marina TaxID=487319 RepID=UPI000472CFE1|nr:GSCFA domain-containing protein [Shewanella marina]
MKGVETTPYSSQPHYAFWRTGVANIKLGRQMFNQLVQMELSTPSPRISSIGSCFAQHVGKWLNNGGYKFNQSNLETSQIASFAFGNIYTPRTLLQWFDMTAENNPFDINSAIYFDNNKYYDLLRPTFNLQGYATQADLVSARVAASNEMRKTLLKTDLLIFTLGLTEVWKDKHNVYYPCCPGVIAGKFDNTVYTFHNFSYQEIYSDLEQIYTRLKSINSKIQLLLTVSPVPLTATMTDKHIMVANQYSKSLLRTVAGSLSDKYRGIEYFPSYELITVSDRQDFRFETNLRTVTPQAVDYVMQHFQSVINNTTDAKLNISSHHQSIEQNKSNDNDVVCEDELLEAANKLTKNQIPQVKLNISLFGDSHMGKLSSALSNIEIKHCGGMIMNGAGFAQHKFALCDSEYFVPLESAISRKLWSKIVTNLDAHKQDNTQQHSIIITNLGMQTHQTIYKFAEWLARIYPDGIEEISTKEFVDYFNDELIDQLTILLKLHNQGHKLIVVSDPPFCQYFQESEALTKLIYSYFLAMEYVCNQLGFIFFNAATIFDQEISDPESYLSKVEFADGHKDWMHGNEKYYHWLANKLMMLIQDK